MRDVHAARGVERGRAAREGRRRAGAARERRETRVQRARGVGHAHAMRERRRMCVAEQCSGGAIDACLHMWSWLMDRWTYADAHSEPSYINTSTGQRSFAYSGPAVWNSLPPALRENMSYEGT